MLADYAKRLTLYEHYLVCLRGSQPIGVIPRLPEDYIYGEKLNMYPRLLRKPLKNHERRLLKIVSDQNILYKLTPELSIKNGWLIVARRLARSRVRHYYRCYNALGGFSRKDGAPHLFDSHPSKLIFQAFLAV